MTHHNAVRTRDVEIAELKEISRCYDATFASWGDAASPEDASDFVKNPVVALAIEIPPSATSQVLYAVCVEGSVEPLLIQARGEDRELYEAGVGLRPGAWGPAHHVGTVERDMPKN